MKRIILAGLVVLLGGCLKVNAQTMGMDTDDIKKMFNTKNYSVVNSSMFKTLAVNKFSFTGPMYKNNYNYELKIITFKENDTTAYALMSIGIQKGKVNLELPKTFLSFCQFDKGLRIMDEEKFFLSLGKNIKTTIEKYLGLHYKKKIYVVLLNNQLYDEYVVPKESGTIQDIMLLWKLFGEERKSDQIYSFGVYDKGIFLLDRENCLSYPHDNLLKGKITWRRDYSD